MEMSKNKLSITEFSVLEVLYLKGKQTINQINESILISSSSMTYVIDQLEKKGFLHRQACPEDRRAIHLVMTDSGSNLMKKIMPEHQELVNEMFSEINNDDTVTMVKLLKNIRKRAEK